MSTSPFASARPPVILDADQQRAADWREGPVFVTAAAGAGKSAILIERLAALIMEGTPPERTLTLMYNTAAAEMFRKRLEGRIGKLADRCVVKTFHSFSLGLLKDWFGGTAEWTQMKLLMEGESYALARKVIAGLGIRANSRVFLQATDVMREKMLDFENEKFMSPDLPPKLLKFARQWQKQKALENRYDFADMLYLAAKVIQKEEAALEEYLGIYHHVQVDETQDLSRARWAVCSAFGWRAKSFMLVGDLRQSLYGWSGSDMNILHEFIEGTETRAPAKLIVLPTNRRSTHKIVALANKIAGPYAWHMGGDTKALSSADVGVHPEVWTVQDAISEADKIVDLAQKVHVERQAAAQADPTGALNAPDRRAPIAVLCRTNAWGIIIEQRLMAAGIPVTTRGNNSGAWATNEGKDFLAYLQLVEGDGRADISRIANKPNRYLNKEAIEELKLSCASAETGGGSRLAALIDELHNHPKRGAGELALLLSELAELPWEKRCAKIGQILRKDAVDRENEDKDVVKYLHAPEDDDRGDIYVSLGKAAAGFGSYEALQARGKKQIRPGVPAPAPVVEISSIHRYKGDEADTVIVAGVCKDHLPHKKAADLEEEVRIWYVAATRARKRLIVSMGGHPSEFLVECGLVQEVQGRWRTAP